MEGRPPEDQEEAQVITLDTSVLKMPDVAKDTKIVNSLVRDALDRGGR